MQRESLEKTNVSMDTTMCVEKSDDDKAFKDTMLKEVQRTKLPMHNHVINGQDMNKEPQSASTILGMTHQ
jgi:hypothetical protein